MGLSGRLNQCQLVKRSLELSLFGFHLNTAHFPVSTREHIANSAKWPAVPCHKICVNDHQVVHALVFITFCAPDTGVSGKQVSIPEQALGGFMAAHKDVQRCLAAENDAGAQQFKCTRPFHREIVSNTACCYSHLSSVPVVDRI